MYIVMEIQNSGTVATLVNQYSDKNLAESKFHTVLAAAAVSQVPVHSAVLMTDEGVWLRSECYKHPLPEPTPEPDSEADGDEQTVDE